MSAGGTTIFLTESIYALPKLNSCQQVVEIHTHTPSEPIALPEGRIVAISQYTRNALGAPLAVGTMATSSDSIMAENAKGKAVKVLHIFKDKLWEMGKRGTPPEPISISDVDSSIQEPENTAEIEGGEDPEKSEEKGEEEPSIAAHSGSIPTSTSVNPQKSDDLAQPLLDPQGKKKTCKTIHIEPVLTIFHYRGLIYPP